LDLAGKVAVVTGASSGIGEATARRLADEGMTVVAVARRVDRLLALGGEHGRIFPHPADVTSDEDIRELAARVESEFQTCQLLVNNAGVSGRRRLSGLDDLEGFRSVVDVNLIGTVRCMAALAPLLAASAPSRVVNVASVAGKIGIGPPAYTASKFAVVGVSETLRLQWARRGVAVCTVIPGFISTEGFPQSDLLGSRLTRWLVSGPEVVADAIADVARSGARERTVPRWYRVFVVARHLAAPPFWAAARRASTYRK
jgi:NAD(P)-dependent dehydrogenase (short-subunit alcohol dehydrogenase family)